MQLCNSVLALLLLVAPPAHRHVALTFDDLPNLTADEDRVEQTARVMHGIVRHLSDAHVPAIGFVNESKLLDANGDPDPQLVKLLDDWLVAGFDLGNHTFSHEGLSDVGIAAYEEDILKGERITRPLAERHGRKFEWFRHPYLDTGKTLAEEEQLDKFLAEHGYRVAPVTIDDSEWIFAMAYHKARNPITRWRLGRAYIRYMERRFEWYEARSRTVFKREIPQIVLLHADSLNARYLPRLLAMIRRRGYEFIDIEDAMRDPSYEAKDAWHSDAGVSWIMRWGVTRGYSEALFDRDPQTPQWVQKIAGVKEQ